VSYCFTFYLFEVIFLLLLLTSTLVVALWLCVENVDDKALKARSWTRGVPAVYQNRSPGGVCVCVHGAALLLQTLTPSARSCTRGRKARCPRWRFLRSPPACCSTTSSGRRCPARGSSPTQASRRSVWVCVCVCVGPAGHGSVWRVLHEVPPGWDDVVYETRREARLQTTLNKKIQSCYSNYLNLCVCVCVCVSTHRNMEETSGTQHGSLEGCHRRTISGSTKNLSNQGSQRQHFLKDFFKEPINMSHRNFKT